MRRLVLTALVIGFFAPLMVSAPANAQASRTWVSGVGDDVNPCSRTAPCKTFAGAISKTAAAGEINCLDPGGFGAVTVTKSMTISCEIGTAGLTVIGTNAIVFSGQPTDYLFLKGIDIEGNGSGISGIVFNSGGTLHVEDCVIRHFTSFGINIKSANQSTFTVTRTSLFNNGNGTTGGGIGVVPTALVQGTIDRVVADKNTFGIFADGTTGGNYNFAVRDSVLSGNTQAGFSASSGAAVTFAMLTRVVASGNSTGIQVIGGTAQIKVGQSEITGNGTGVSGTVLSFVTNQLNGNGTDGTLTPLPAPQLH